MATAASLIPPLTFKSWLSSGLPNAFGTVATYTAGTVTPAATYVDSTATTQNQNPIQLNARGEASIWTPPNVAFKFVEFDSFGNQINSRDQVIFNQLITLFGGTDTGAPNAYILTFTASFTSYSASPVIYWVPSNNNTGNSTLNVNGLGVVGLYNPNGTQLGANQIIANQITGVIYQTNIANSGNSGFVLISLSNFTGSTIGTFGTESAIASAATTDLGSAFAHVVQITGSTTITSFGASASLVAPIYVVRFNSSLTITYNANTLILPGNASITTSAGDALLAEYLGSGAWKVLIYQYATGNANTKIKPADTARTSNATLTADPDLVSNSLPLGRYAFEIYLVFDSVTAGAGFQWTNVGTAVDSRAAMPTLASGFVNAAAYGPKSETPYSNTITYATVGTAANSNIVLYKGSILVGTQGTFGVSWAQAASTGTATTLRAGSYLTVTQINTGASFTGLTHTYTTGTGTETIPVGYNTLTLEVWGGGGGGGNNGGGIAGGGGGGAGGYSRSVFTVTGLSGQTITYTVGAGGLITVAGTASSCVAGTFAMTTMTANGGTQGGNASGSATPGNGGGGGTAVGGVTLNTTGNSGQGGTLLNGGVGGMATSGIFGSAGAGGNGKPQSGPGGTVGANGLIIFTYST